MATKSGVLDYWRKYFRGANSDIFEVIEYAIVVAAADCPKEFRLRRDRIAEKLFSCRLSRCSGCDHVEVAVPADVDVDGGCDDGFRDVDGFGQKEIKVNSSTNDGGEVNRVSNFSYEEAEALTEEIDEQSQLFGEVLRIKEILDNNQDESDNVLFESLRRLQLMGLSVETLRVTKIGKVVNGLRKCGSEPIQRLARALIDGWKVLVDQWVDAKDAINDGSPDSVNPSTVDEGEGLPSPPLDEGAFLATQTTGMELSQFFDGMDDDGNLHNGGEFDNDLGNRRKSVSGNHVPRRKLQPPVEENAWKEDKSQVKKPEVVVKQTRLFNQASGPGRSPKQGLEHKANGDAKLQQQADLIGVQKKQPPLLHLANKSKNVDEMSVQVKFEAAKRKLHEGYQQAENAKKQRTIQVMELHDLPKQGLGHRNPHMKAATHNRNWANGRR